jgi:hypothetical protein
VGDRQKGSKNLPAVEVIRKPAAPGGPVAPRPVAPQPHPALTPAPRAPVAPRPVQPVQPVQPAAAARPAGSELSPRPSPGRPMSPPRSSPPRGGPPGRGPPARGGFGGKPRFASAPSNRPPPTADQIAILAKKERVPARIAKGELEGKMKARIWKKLHAEEARRFDQAWQLMEQHPHLDLQQAFGVVQSGMPVEEFLARRARVKKKEEVKVARTAVVGDAIDAWIQARIADKAELAFVLGERTAMDALTGVEPVAFTLERSGRLEKLQVVVLALRPTWEKLVPTLTRDPRLAQKPTPVARQPARRPVADPRPFQPLIGRKLWLELRNGLQLNAPLLAVGPFDLLLGTAGDELFVPLHALLRWESRD